MKFKLLFILFLYFSFSASAQETLGFLLSANNKETIPYIFVAELRKLQLNDAALILDAREKNEFDVSHIASAKFVGYDRFSSEKFSEEIKNKETPIIVYCSLGIRSEDVGEKLKKAGFTNIKNLYGGIFEWRNNEYPVIDSDGKETEMIHVFSPIWGVWLTNGKKVY
jgi:rhodanese-related sulfurtransferase